MSARDLSAVNRRAMRCPNCGDAFGALQEDLSMICAGVIVRWHRDEAELRPGCGLRLYLCPAHGLRTRREGDTRCRCGDAAFTQMEAAAIAA